MMLDSPDIEALSLQGWNGSAYFDGNERLQVPGVARPSAVERLHRSTYHFAFVQVNGIADSLTLGGQKC